MLTMHLKLKKLGYLMDSNNVEAIEVLYKKKSENKGDLRFSNVWI